MLSCKELSVELTPGGTRILDRATARFKPKALNAVIGPSGCGKTTLVRAMLGLSSRVGEVFMAGEPVANSEPQNPKTPEEWIILVNIIIIMIDLMIDYNHK